MRQCIPGVGVPTVPGASRVRAKGEGAPPCVATLLELAGLPGLPALDRMWLVQPVDHTITTAAEAAKSLFRGDMSICSIIDGVRGFEGRRVLCGAAVARAG
jgi:hypothetical protein